MMIPQFRLDNIGLASVLLHRTPLRKSVLPLIRYFIVLRSRSAV